MNIQSLMCFFSCEIKNVDIKFSAHDVFPEHPPSGTLYTQC